MPIIQTSDNSSFFHIFGSGGYESIYDGEAESLKELPSSGSTSDKNTDDGDIALELVPSAGPGTDFTAHRSKIGDTRFESAPGRDLRLVVTSSQRHTTGKTELSSPSPLSLFGEELPSPVHHFFGDAAIKQRKNGSRIHKEVVERLSSMEVCFPVQQQTFSFQELPEIVSPQIAHHGKYAVQQTMDASSDQKLDVTYQKFDEAPDLDRIQIAPLEHASRTVASISLNPASVIPNGFSRGPSTQHPTAMPGHMYSENIERQVLRVAHQQTLVMPQIHKQKQSKVTQFSPGRQQKRAEPHAAGQPAMKAHRGNMFGDVLSPSPEVKEVFRLDHWDGESAYPVRTESSGTEGPKKVVTISAARKTRQKTSMSSGKNTSGQTSRAGKSSRASKRSNASSARSSKPVNQEPGLGRWTPRSPTERTKTAAPSSSKTSRHGVTLSIPGTGNLEEYMESIDLPHANVLEELSARHAKKWKGTDLSPLQVPTDLHEVLSSRQKPSQVRTSPIKSVVRVKMSTRLDSDSDEDTLDRFLHQDSFRNVSPLAQRVIVLEQQTPISRTPSEPQSADDLSDTSSRKARTPSQKTATPRESRPPTEPAIPEDHRSETSSQKAATQDAGATDETMPESSHDNPRIAAPAGDGDDSQLAERGEEDFEETEDVEDFEGSEGGDDDDDPAEAASNRSSGVELDSPEDARLSYFLGEGGMVGTPVESRPAIPAGTPNKPAATGESKLQRPPQREPPRRDAAPVVEDVGMELRGRTRAMTLQRPLKGFKREAHKTAIQNLAQEGVRTIPVAPERPVSNDGDVKPAALVFWGAGVPFEKVAEDHSETIEELWRQAQEREEQKARKKAGISDVIPQMEFQPSLTVGRSKQQRRGSRRDRRTARVWEKQVLERVQEREASLQRLESCISSIGYGDEVPEDSTRSELVSLLLGLRAQSLAVCEAIWSWQHETRQPAKPFVWKGEDYVDKLAHDLHFTGRYAYVVETLGVQGPFSLANSAAPPQPTPTSRHAMMVRKQADVAGKEKALRRVSAKDDARIRFCLKNIQKQQPSVRWQLDDDDETEPPTTGHGRKVTISRGTTGLSRGTSSLGSRGTEFGLRSESDGMPFGGRASPYTPTPILKPASRRMGTGSTSPLLELLGPPVGEHRTTHFEDMQAGESGRKDYLKIERGDSRIDEIAPDVVANQNAEGNRSEVIDIPDESASQKGEPDQVSGSGKDFGDEDWLARQPRVALKSGSGRDMMHLNMDEAVATVVINETNNTASKTGELDDRRLRRKLRSRKGVVTFDRHPRSYEDAGSKQDPRQLDLETMRFVFASMDRDGDGLIVFKDLTEELSSLPLQADLFQLSEMFMQHAMKSKNKEPAMDVRSFSAMLPELQRMYKVLRGHPEGSGTELYSFVVGAENETMEVAVEPGGDDPEEPGGEEPEDPGGDRVEEKEDGAEADDFDPRAFTSMTRTSDGGEQLDSRALTSMTRTSDGNEPFDSRAFTSVTRTSDKAELEQFNARGWTSNTRASDGCSWLAASGGLHSADYDNLTFDLPARADSGIDSPSIA